VLLPLLSSDLGLGDHGYGWLLAAFGLGGVLGAGGHLAVAEVNALAGQHPRAARVGAIGQLGDEARLADAGLAGDERHRRAAVGGAIERGEKAGKLALAADELRAGHPLRHPARPRAIARVYGASRACG
jgi:hypothetical protein